MRRLGWVFVVTAFAWGCGSEGTKTGGDQGAPDAHLPDVGQDAPAEVASDAIETWPDEEGGVDPGPEPGPEAADDAPDAVEVPLDAMEGLPEAVPPDEGVGLDGEVAEPRPATEWEVGVAASRPGFKARVALAVGPDGVPQVAYNQATSADRWDVPDVWHAELRGGSWQHRIVAPAGGVSNEFPVLVVDASNRAHVFWNRYVPAQDQIDIFRASPEPDGAVPEAVGVTSTEAIDEFAPVAAMDSDGTIHLLFQERQGVGDAAQWSIGHVVLRSGDAPERHSLASGTQFFSLSPDYALAAGASGRMHAVYPMPGEGGLATVLWYREWDGVSWGDAMRVTPADQDAWGPAVAVGQDGAVHVVATLGPDWNSRTLYHIRIEDGAVTETAALTGSVEDRSYYLGLAPGSGGDLHVAFTRFSGANADVLHVVLDKGGVPGAEARVTDTPDGDEFATAMATRSDGTPYLAFVESLSTAPDGRVYLARTVGSEVSAIVASAIEEAGIPSITTDFPSGEVEAQSAAAAGVVSFDAALRAAIESFLTDGTDPESPLALVSELDAGPCLEPDDLARVRCFMDRQSSSLALVRLDGTPGPAEHGEQVSDKWVFYLHLPELSDHGHWAIVDRAGKAATYNYGFN